MNTTYNVYCDESCHLLNDGQGIMVLGAVWCPLEKTHSISRRLRHIKQEHHLSPKFETKWVKVSPAKLLYYREVLDFFFEEEDLHFRALIVPDKSRLDHVTFSQTHDDWYYKMYFEMLRGILSPEDRYRVYLDYKDTHSYRRAAKLDEVLRNNMRDYEREVLERTQVVRSDEVEILQLTDLLIGSIAYANRSLSDSPAKSSLVERMRKKSRYSLLKTTMLRENKVNLFHWRASEGRVHA